MYKITKEQFLFAVIGIMATLFLKNTLNSSTLEQRRPPDSGEAVSHGRDRSPLLHQKIFCESFYSYWSGAFRIHFARTARKKIAAGQVTPTVCKGRAFNFSPMPAPASEHWNKFPLRPFSVLPAESIVFTAEMIEAVFADKKPKKKSAMAQRLATMVRDKDVVITSDGKSFAGKIISDNTQELIIHIGKQRSTQNLVLPKHRVAQVQNSISLEEICQHQFKMLAPASPDAFLELPKLWRNYSSKSWRRNFYPAALPFS